MSRIKTKHKLDISKGSIKRKVVIDPTYHIRHQWEWFDGGPST